MAQTAMTRPCHVEINGLRRLSVQPGRSLLATLAEERIFLPTACGGRGFCGQCQVKVLTGGGPVTEREDKRLGPDKLGKGWRLACQVLVLEDLAVEIPPELLETSEIRAVCTRIEDLTYDVRRFRFDMKAPRELGFCPGQYVQFRCPTYDRSHEAVTRAYSIASNPADKNGVELIIRRVPHGTCTTYLFDHLKVGDPVTLNGPHGDFRLSTSDAPMVFIAGGSGMAPFVSILHHLVNTGSGRQATLFFGGNMVKDLYLSDRIRRFEQELHGFRFVPVVARAAECPEWTGEKGLVTEAVTRTYGDLSGYEGYLCGPPGMIDASVKVLIGLGMPQDRVYFDKFS